MSRTQPPACKPWLLAVAGLSLLLPANARAANPQESPPQFAEQTALSPNEPLYFVVGGSGDTTARFQFSFKYRMFDPESGVVRTLPVFADFYFAYGQTSLWNLSEDSKPFQDTSYRPSLFFQRWLGRRDLFPDFWRFGYQHESNGQTDPLSRSLDILFLQPGWNARLLGRDLFVVARLFAYLDKEENPDIHRYRGNTNWLLRLGNEDGWVAASEIRRSIHGKGSVQLDLSYPIRRPLFARTGGFFHLQLFSGYGESLIGYDTRETNLRLGFSIVR